jgi:hypothetical protein
MCYSGLELRCAIAEVLVVIALRLELDLLRLFIQAAVGWTKTESLLELFTVSFLLHSRLSVMYH